MSLGHRSRLGRWVGHFVNQFCIFLNLDAREHVQRHTKNDAIVIFDLKANRLFI